MKTTEARDRAMLAAFEAGYPLEQIARDYGVTERRAQAVLTAEKHRRLVSPEPFYRELRAQLGIEDGPSEMQRFSPGSVSAKTAQGTSRILSRN